MPNRKTPPEESRPPQDRELLEKSYDLINTAFPEPVNAAPESGSDEPPIDPFSDED